MLPELMQKHLQGDRAGWKLDPITAGTQQNVTTAPQRENLGGRRESGD